ncbi:hypothetical protein ACFMB7_27220 [Bacillus toyonensis]
MSKEQLDQSITLYETKKYNIKEITEKTDVSKTKLHKELNERKKGAN